MKAKRKATKPAMVATVRVPSLAEVEEFYGLRMRHHVAEINGVALAMGTLARTNGQLWGWFDRREGMTPRQGVAVIRALIRGMREIGEPVYVTCNEGVHANASRLLRLVGFRPTGQSTNGFNIWVHNG